MLERDMAEVPGEAMEPLREYKELPATALFESLQVLLRELTTSGILQGTQMREEALRLTLREFVQHKSVRLAPVRAPEVLQPPVRSFFALLEELWLREQSVRNRTSHGLVWRRAWTRSSSAAARPQRASGVRVRPPRD
eukprot:Amastigsp_a176847_9.p1 type:complete len:138 gc:universal Amastigsp_a176847_9:358-771(+)